MILEKNIHFIGIGGISMSALAVFLLEKGKTISGSDINPEVTISGIKVFHSHKKDNIKDVELVVYNSAINEDNPEIIEARSQNLKIISRAELLGEIASEYENVISISGVHGKTTTTEILAEIFIEANLNPTVHIGGISNKFHSNILIGEKKYFITEACEYKDSFLSLKSKVGVVLNVEPEHLDYFKTFTNEKKSFLNFSKQCECVVAPNNLSYNKAITFGQDGIFTARKISKLSSGEFCFDCYKNKKKYATFIFNTIGLHNIQNALSAIAVADYFKINKEKIKSALKHYCGVKRRMEIIKKSPLVICDYAHHPTEIKSTIESVRAHYNKKLFILFQPHTYSRTIKFFFEFVDILKSADKLYLIETYSAREKKIFGGTAKELFKEIKKYNKNTQYFTKKYKKIARKLKKVLKNEEILLILGAGDIIDLLKYIN